MSYNHLKSKYSYYNKRSVSSYYYINQAYQSSTNKKRRWPTVILSMLVLGLVIKLSGSTFSHSVVAKTLTTTNTIKMSTYSPSSNTTDTMGKKINDIIAAHPGVQISVSITELHNDANYNYGVKDGYEAASTAKLITAAVFLHKVETGQHSLDETVNGHSAGYELQQMIVNSDNDAWHAFNNLLTHPVLESWATQHGLINYDADNNILTSKDIALLLTQLYKNKLLSLDHTQLLLTYMQNASEDQYIVSAVPEGVKVYHKAGWLDDRVHDAAIIDDGHDPYVLVIFTKVDGIYDTQVGQTIFHDLTKATTDTFVKPN